ncbi:MAG: DNA-protecting protein DprA, partial [Gemmatimonadetes bacterium]|nr:DNA-protecting protein DprA [Gemmatimonadota bacterium]NIR42083.1 DNA-protecting protein DprA [Actinomycetota bacterium]NIU71681.1 DNA-protecting protein DprA [Actinomycetota bacterium]NIW33633.1 DNA-protecting protein DprA [Actinomycetota bacterium]NIX25730.1 DNA-protecting protein DprA [Actinomycetota bacterium]
LTEYPPGTPPRRHHFPERNRIVAGLARAVVVVEAAGRSGALVTARQAVDEGREVLAVPGSILSDLSVGPNALLRLGARPVVTPRDVLETLGLEPAWDG